MQEKIKALCQKFTTQLSLIKNLQELEHLKVEFFGKKGIFQDLLLFLRTLPLSQRASLGREINQLKEELLQLYQQAFIGFGQAELSLSIAHEKIDATLPGRRLFMGRKHPLGKLKDEVISIFSSLGFSVQYSPDVDSDWYNYESLNFPPDHPAREMQDTFYIDATLLLRSHTSNAQIRVMERTTPPVRVIVPGTVYRNENISARSHVFFHQVEGFYVDQKVSLADLLDTMRTFWCRLLGKQIKMRFRPSYFPFVEPGLEIDISCAQCEGKGCSLCKENGWLEVAGAGMIHPEVLKNGGVDPELYSGYAWGLGLERLAMLLYGIDDIRLFSQNDLRFLSQF